ncbi:zinc finger, CCHC-type containing protein [Tanacetum coccineum]
MIVVRRTLEAELSLVLTEFAKEKKKRSSGAGGVQYLSLYELNTSLYSWIYDTGCGTHICNTTQGLRASRKLKPGALSLYVVKDQRKAVITIGNFDVNLSLRISYCFETIVIMHLSILEDVIPRDGIFEIDLSNSYTNDSSICAISNKRAKLDLDSALLWHCRLGHISKKRIEKLQHDGLLNSTDLRA